MTKNEMLKEMLNNGEYKANAERYAKALKKTSICAAYIIYNAISHTRGKKALDSFVNDNFSRVRPLKTLPYYEASMEAKRG